jgi:hypothetical protein
VLIGSGTSLEVIGTLLVINEGKLLRVSRHEEREAVKWETSKRQREGDGMKGRGMEKRSRERDGGRREWRTAEAGK